MLDLIPTALADSGITYTDLEGLNFNDVIYLFAAIAIWERARCQSFSFFSAAFRSSSREATSRK